MTESSHANGLAAVRAFERWRTRVTIAVVSAFAVSGFAMIALFTWLAGEAGARSIPAAFIGSSAVAEIIVLVVGLAVARGLVNARAVHALSRLADRYRIPVEELARKARLRVRPGQA